MQLDLQSIQHCDYFGHLSILIYPKYVSGSVRVLIQMDKSGYIVFFQKILFVLGLYEYLESLEGKIRDDIFFCINKSDNFSVCNLEI